MNFLNLEDIRNLVCSLKKIPDEESYFQNSFEPISCGIFTIHLSAGAENCSEPRSSVYTKLSDYSKIQVVIQEGIKSSNSEFIIVSPLEDDRFRRFEWSKYFSYIPQFGTSSKPVFSYIGDEVLFEDLLQLIKDCYKISRLKIFF